MKDFISLVTPFFQGSERVYARWGGILLLALSQITTGFSYLFIQWNKRFYDALEAKNAHAFFYEAGYFLIIAAILVLIASFAKYFGQCYAIRWRVWMTENTLRHWLVDSKRGELEGSDQRIQEDLMRFTIIFERFCIECFNSLLLIIVLIPILFYQARNIYLANISIAWWVVLSIIAYTALGMLVSAKIANPLIDYEYDNQRLEAKFRYNLVHARDGKSQSFGFFQTLMQEVSLNYTSIYTRQKYFNIWQQFYNQCSFLIPFALLAGNYFQGLITLGALMQIKSIYSRIRNSMAYLLDKYTELTEMLAISKRLVEFYKFADFEFHTNANKHQPVLD